MPGFEPTTFGVDCSTAFVLDVKVNMNLKEASQLHTVQKGLTFNEVVINYSFIYTSPNFRQNFHLDS